MITIVTETERKSQFVGADQSNGEWYIFITTHVVHVVSLLFAVYSGQPSVNIVFANIKTNMPFFCFFPHCTSASAPCSQVHCQHFPAREKCCVDTGP